MSEPTIYKPSIYNVNGIYKGDSVYKGNGVYNDGDGGGLPGYDVVQIGNLLWINRNYDEDLGTNGVDQNQTTFPNGGKVYSGNLIINKLSEIEVDGWRVPTKDDLILLEQEGYYKLVTTDPNYANFVGNDIYGFNMLMVGYSFVNQLNITGVKATTNFWCKTYAGSNIYDLNFQSGTCSMMNHNPAKFMLSLRLCKDV